MNTARTSYNKSRTMSYVRRKQCNVHIIMYVVCNSLHGVQYTSYNVRRKPFNVYIIMYVVCNSLRGIQYTSYNVRRMLNCIILINYIQCIYYYVHSSLYTVHYTF